MRELQIYTAKLKQEKFIPDSVSEKIESIYQEVENADAKFLLQGIHQKTETLLNAFDGRMEKYLNTKKTIHFWAAQSKDLAELIKRIPEIRKHLNMVGTYSLNENLKIFFEKIRTKLSLRGGSAIPTSVGLSGFNDMVPVFNEVSSSVVVKTPTLKFELKDLGSGSFAQVHSFKDTDYGISLARKTLKSGDKKDRERFVDEFKIMSTISHPNVLTVYNLFNEADKRPFYYMELAGSTLKKFIDSNNSTIDTKTRKRLIYQLLNVVYFLWGNNILHRDISSNNILVNEYDSGPKLLLSDFGLAKIKEGNTLTAESLKGTIIDPTLDSFKNYGVINEIYSLGFISYYILTGRTNTEISEAPEFINKCWDDDPAKRHQSIEEVIKGFNKWASSK